MLLLIAWAYFLHISEDITGDIGKLGQIIFSKEYHLQDKFCDVPVSSIDWCDTTDFKTKSVLFLGDSFSFMVDNRSDIEMRSIYPNCLVSMIGKNAAKFCAENINSPEGLFVALCNSDVKMPEIVVLESVGRFFVSRLHYLDFSSNIKPKASSWEVLEGRQTDFSTFYKNQIIDNHAILNVPLKDSLFTCPRKENELYFYYEDLSFPDEDLIQTAVSKLDTLFQLAKRKNISLFYVVAADKYDVYQEFAIENGFPKKEVLEKFEKFESNPYFVNTKTVLVEKARQGVKDMYYADDTHWSPVGAQIVAEEIASRMDSLGVLKTK